MKDVNDSLNKCREAFEAWAKANGHRTKKITRPYYGEVYTDEMTHYAWESWQAAWAYRDRLAKESA